MKTIVPTLALTVFLSSGLFARTWTSTDGVRIDAEFVSADDKGVTIRRNDGRRFTVSMEKLSQEDKDWVKDKLQTGNALAGLPEDVAALVAEHGTILFEDNFDREDSDTVDEMGAGWKTNSDSRAQGDKQCDLVDGKLVMTLSPKADHGISVNHDTSEPYQDAVLYVKMKLESGEKLKLAYNDKMFKEVHAGHINGVTIDEKSLILDDEKNGRFSAAADAMKTDPSKKDERAALTAKWQKKFAVKISTGDWHDVVTVHRGETLTVYIDGKEVATHTSVGFAHPTKRQLAFAVAKKATVDDLKIWKLTPAGE